MMCFAFGAAAVGTIGGEEGRSYCDKGLIIPSERRVDRWNEGLAIDE